MKHETIYYAKQYGSVCIDIKEIMFKQGINRNKLARSINTRFEVINKWYKGEVEKLDLDILARICYVLDCNISDIVRYNKPQNHQPKS